MREGADLGLHPARGRDRLESRTGAVLGRAAAPPFRHGYTYGGHPAACVAGLANLDILQRERLVERVVELEPVLDAAVRESFADSPLAYDVRSAGLLAAVELPPAVLAAEPGCPI